MTDLRRGRRTASRTCTGRRLVPLGAALLALAGAFGTASDGARAATAEGELPRAAAGAPAVRTASGARLPAVPHTLPPAGARAAAAGDADGWIVGAHRGATSRRIAARFGARAVGDWGAWAVGRTRARAFAEALRGAGAYLYAHADRRVRLSGSSDPMTASARWRDAVVRPDLAPPLVTAQTPLVALIDSQLDASHPEFAGSNVTTTGGGAVDREHGTATAGMVSAPVNGIGFEGIWPNARTVNLPTTLECSDIVDRVADALRLGARVLNMSYGSADPCFAEYVALQVATARGVLLVAAAGNELEDGNPLEYPASLPHVFTVAAASTRTRAAAFSNANAAIDISAPGEDVLTTVPPALDPDGDGYATLSGTSFAAPIVSGAAAWLRAARPDLDPFQLQQVLRASADDMDSRGWDVRTGWGFIDLAGALVQRAPRRDPLEPNDGLPFVDGTAFGRPAPPVLSSARTSAQLDAHIDSFEDPLDVYRVVVPARRSVRVSVRPRFGDPRLVVVRRGATSLTARRWRVGVSSRPGRRTEAVVVRNRERAARSFLVAVEIDADAGGPLNSGYRLSVSRR